MSGQEARINDALKQLGEEFRLGMVQAAEYRARRKMLIESWGDRDATTSPRALRTNPNAVGRRAAAAPVKKMNPAALIVAVLAAVLVIGVAAWFLVGSRKAPSPAPVPALPQQAPMSEGAQAAAKAADDFVARNAWDADAVNAFLSVWRGLGAADRTRLADEPAMRTLKYKLEQNIQAEMQLITPDSSPEDRQRLTLLQDFARELTGEAQ